ncbi:hypothetical protein [Deinococcus puniceus]|uniref:hypothetical protein n=1 Tax=Deinococcus puniceus TaxID=1182568 RepID=UPI000AD47E0B|nr:hypothetical protein [Deinococcus puniceus]
MSETSIVEFFEKMKAFASPEEIIEHVADIKTKKPKISDDAIWDKICKRAKIISTGQGVVASLPGAIPGVGTVAQIALMTTTISAETWLQIKKMSYLHLAKAHLSGEDVFHEDRKEELILILGIMTGAVVPVKEGAKRFGATFAFKQTMKISGKALKEINKKVGFTLLTKMGTKRGGVALGRVIPLGVGALIGGGANLAAMHSFIKSLNKYFSTDHPQEYTVKE